MIGALNAERVERAATRTEDIYRMIREMIDRKKSYSDNPERWSVQPFEVEMEARKYTDSQVRASIKSLLNAGRLQRFKNAFGGKGAYYTTPEYAELVEQLRLDAATAREDQRDRWKVVIEKCEAFGLEAPEMYGGIERRYVALPTMEKLLEGYRP